MNRTCGIVMIAHCLVPMALCADETAIEDRPYDVRVQIAFDSTAEFDGSYRGSVVDQVVSGIERCLGRFWRCEVCEEQGDLFSGPQALKRLASETLVRRANFPGADKVYLIAVTSVGAGMGVTGREWDASTRQLSPLAVRTALDRRDLSSLLLSMIRNLFRPVAEIDQPRSGRTSLRGRGANLCAADASWSALPPGQLFEAYQCILNKDHVVERIQRIPWTFLTSGSDLGAGRRECTVTTGLRSPLSGRRQRIQTMALAVTSRGAETRLHLVTRAPARKPLAGVEVELLPIMSPRQPDNEIIAADAAPVPQVLITDRNGRVLLKVDETPEAVPDWLIVRSGQTLLARVPFLPGLHAVEEIELPDDSLRLEVEGDVALLQAKLVDTVARRAVLMAQARARAKAGEHDIAKAVIQDLEALPKAPKFVEELNLIRLNRLKTARARRDKSTEERIKKLCTETTELVTNYLNEEKLTDLRDEIGELRRATEESAVMEAKARAADARAAGVVNGEPEPTAATGKPRTGKPKKKKKTATTTPSAPVQPATGF